MLKLFRIVPCIVGLLALAACSDEPASGEDNQEDNQEVVVKDLTYISSLELTESETKVVEGNNTFAWNFFAKSIEKNDGKNIVLSPLSVSIALTMLANGTYADSPARTEIINALGLSGKEMSEVNSCMVKLADGIDRLDKETQLALANSLWVNKEKLTLNSDFVTLLRRDFYAGTYSIIDQTYVSDVNSWCDAATRGMIKSLLPEGHEAPDMALINATYFKGMWNKRYGFDEKDTTKSNFENSDKTISQADFMTATHLFTLRSDDMTESIDIPFGNGNYNFRIVRPKDGHSVSDCAKNLIEDKWNPQNKRRTTELLELKLPKFDISLNQEIKENLAELGMAKALETTDYYFAAPQGLNVGKILHQARFSVNEKGAEAAAVTDIEIEPGAPAGYQPEGKEPRPFHLDHPFIYLITEKSSEAIIFIGCVNKL